MVDEGSQENSKPTEKKKKTYSKSAKTAVMDFLAKRDHSPRELLTKLSKRYSIEEAKEAIEWAKENNWIAADEVLSEKFSHHLHLKKKGIRYINAKLNQRGLPRVHPDEDLELKKAIDLIENKKIFKESLSALVSKKNLKTENKYESKDEFEKLKAKIGRFLVSRGFDMTIVRKVVYEYFKNTSSYE